MNEGKSLAELAYFARKGESEVRTVDPDSGGEKGVKLFRYDLVPAKPLEELALLYGLGAQKYVDRNWELGYDWSKSYGALQRHANKWWMGETMDEETNVSHMTNVAWHAFALVHFEHYLQDKDDRPVLPGGMV